MLLVGLTGGVGSGKSTVARMLAERGAVVLDADAIVRDLQRPGTAVFERIVARFGDAVVAADGGLDRGALAAIVFDDDAARADLNGIVHPAVWDVISAELDRLRETDRVVVLDVPLLVEGRGKDLVDLVVVVEAPADVRVDRVVAERGGSPEDVRARIAAQASDDERRAVADVVILNDGPVDALAGEVDRLWGRITEDR